MKVYISDIKVIEDKKHGGITYRITGQLPSGLEIKIKDLFYAEYKMGMINQPFSPEKYYSVELIEELLKKKGFNSKDNGSQDIILTGEYIDSYVIPEKWIPLMEPKWFRRILKEPSAIKTDDGIFLFYPFHMRKRVSIESFPKNVSIITGCIDLAAWHPIP